jgi:hypothetical protein
MTDYNNNPTGIGGFKEHPENINRNGTPGRQGLKLLRDAMARRATKEGKTLYELFVEKAYENNTILIEALKKLVPNAQALEITGEMTLKDFFGVLRGEEIAGPGDPPPKPTPSPVRVIKESEDKPTFEG